MGSIESSIGTTTTSSNKQQLRHFVVDNDENENEEQVDDFAEERAIVNEMREAQNKPIKTEDDVLSEVVQLRKEKNVISKNSKNKLEALLGLKTIYATIDIDGVKITLKNLSALDMKNALDKISLLSKTKLQEVFDTRNVFLGLSLYKIDDQLMSDILGENDDIETRLSLIENMSEDAIAILDNFYDTKIKIKLPQKQNEAEEVISEIKK